MPFGAVSVAQRGLLLRGPAATRPHCVPKEAHASAISARCGPIRQDPALMVRKRCTMPPWQGLLADGTATRPRESSSSRRVFGRLRRGAGFGLDASLKLFFREQRDRNPEGVPGFDGGVFEFGFRCELSWWSSKEDNSAYHEVPMPRLLPGHRFPAHYLSNSFSSRSAMRSSFCSTLPIRLSSIFIALS